MSSIVIYYYFEKGGKVGGENARKMPKPLNPLMYQISKYEISKIIKYIIICKI